MRERVGWRRAARAVLLCLIGALLLSPALAQDRTSAPADTLAANVERLAAQFRGQARIDATYAPGFLTDVPEAKLRALQRDVEAAIGPFARFELTDRKGPQAAVLTAIHARGRTSVEVAFDPASGLVTGLLITDVRRDADSVAGIVAELRALPGTVTLLVERTPADGTGPAETVAALSPDRPMAVASTYKLAILAALADEVALGRRRWADVVPLGAPSPPASALARWPTGAPLTLHSLAALAISVSDNRAADTLMDMLGRDTVAARLAKTGLADPDRTLPLLTTREAFALKSPGNAELLARFLGAPEDEQAAILDRGRNRLGAAQVELGALGSAPVAIDRIEWYMSMRNLADLIRPLAIGGDAQVRAILALNPGTGEAAAARWDWIGYKGGSEPGVYATVTVAEKGAHRFVVSAAWNDPAKLLDEQRFAGLMRRLVDALPR